MTQKTDLPRGLILWALLAVAAIPTGVRAAPVDYANEVKPILQKRCWSCHSRLKQNGGLRLDAGKLVHDGGKAGKVILPGKSGESALVKAVTAAKEDERMPPEGKPLTAEQIAVLKQWIDEGAAYPADEAIPARPQDHWAFQTVRRPKVPTVKGGEWVKNPIDSFVLARLEERGWAPAPSADTTALARRIYLDLTGLPPALQELEEFTADNRPDKIAQLVDNLLGRSAYGEKWARHWLDLVRYAETNGYERDDTKPYVWRYRDYVIRAFNADRPFNRFILEQLAGDELPDANPETVIATGYNRLAPWDDEPADPGTDRYDQLDDLVSTTSQVFLGLTLGCARCHDHKFEPLSTRDYYRMVAIFNPLQRARDGRTEHTRPAGSVRDLRELAKRDAEIKARQEQIAQAKRDLVGQLWASGKSGLPEAVQEAFKTAEGKRNEAQKKLTAENGEKAEREARGLWPERFAKEVDAREAEIAALRRATPDLPQGYFMHEPAGAIPVTRVLMRGQPSKPGAEAPPGLPEIVSPTPAVIGGGSAAPTSGRRLALAQWLASESNPLTARVLVNRIWQLHFGAGLVRTPSDFGVMGEAPTHPELLDWLAHWFTHEGGWSIKALHRLILASATYQMGHDPDEARAAADPENRLLWRRPYRRLDAETIRDAMLFTSGALNTAMYGPSVLPAIPQQALEGHSDPDKIWKPSAEADASRRTIYCFIKRSLVIPMLESLDLCESAQTSAQRAVTTVAPQALTLFNGEFVNQQARHFARRLAREAGPKPHDQVRHAYRLALGRNPTTREAADMERFVEEQTAKFASEPGAADGETPEQRAAAQLCRVVLNLNEFVYPN